MTAQAQAYADRFLDLVQSSPSSYHAVATGIDVLEAAGFQAQEQQQQWQSKPGRYFLRRGGALIAWVVPENAGPTTPFRILGSHTDSPGLKLKINGDLQSAGWQQAAVEIYGGPILASWFDRDLCLAGRIVLRDGSTKLVRTEPLLRVPHLAIHLDPEANKELKLDRQRHMQPVFSVGQTDHSILAELAQAAGVEEGQILSHDLITCDTQPPQRIGADGNLIASGRLDNLASFFPNLDALIAAADQPGDAIMVAAAFDHEEVGSQTTTGAAGPLLGEILERILFGLGADFEQQRRSFAASSCVSADVAHAIHPNYSDKHDKVNFPAMGEGPVIKSNALQRYATDAQTQALWLHASEKAKVASQVYVGKNSVPCGQTIGPITATRLGIDTVDVGIPILSMHSARELAHCQDLLAFSQVAQAYLVG